MDLIIDLGLCDVRVRSDRTELLESIKALFNHRVSTELRPDVTVMDCRVYDEPDKFFQYAETTDFNSCEVLVSPAVTAKYQIDDDVTLIRVEHTAIIVLTRENPFSAKVFLEPETPKAGHKPLPEAFFYPMLVEWLRNIGGYLVHCGAITMHDRAVILVGPPGSGKSTHVLRMVKRGAGFLADDLMLIHRDSEKIMLRPFREVANLGEGSVERFEEMSFIRSAPRRGDGKFQVDIAQFFKRRAAKSARPGMVLHLYPDQEAWIRKRPADGALEGMHNMAFFLSRKDESAENFFILTDMMLGSHHLDVSQGYLAENLDELMLEMSGILETMK